MLRPLRTLYEYFALYSSLTLLGLICLTWSVFALPLYFVLPRRLGTAVGRRGIMTGFRIYAWYLSATRGRRAQGRPPRDPGAQSSLPDRCPADSDAAS
jgi:hypothetical protein